jgi:predicted DNA-binding protein
MANTLTFRLDTERREKLRRKARLFGKTESEFLRDLLDRELEERPKFSALSRLKGALSLSDKKPNAWREEIRQRNWRS